MKWDSPKKAFKYAREQFMKGTPDSLSMADAALAGCVSEGQAEAYFMNYAIAYHKAKLGGTGLSLDNLQKAAEAGLAPAQHDLALHYLYGEYTDEDPYMALIWMERAAAQGYGESSRMLIRLYRFNRKIKRNELRASYWKARYNGDLCDENLSPLAREDVYANVQCNDAGEDSGEESVIKRKTRQSDNEQPVKTDKLQAEHTGLDETKKIQYEKLIGDKVMTSCLLTDVAGRIREEIRSGRMVNIVLSNEAEMAYVSAMFLQGKIAHDIETADGKEKVCLWKAQTQKTGFSRGCVFVSELFIRQGCSMETEKVWEGLQEASMITRLDVKGTEFYEYSDMEKEHRWGCGDSARMTHIVIRSEDIKVLAVFEGDQPVSLMKDSKNYIILSKRTAEQLGDTTVQLWNGLEQLVNAGAIQKFPILITGLVLSGTDEGYTVKGIGQMKFDEY